MSMQTNYFLNRCEEITEKYLDFLSSPEEQKEYFFRRDLSAGQFLEERRSDEAAAVHRFQKLSCTENSLISCDDFLECFIESVSNFLDTDEYKFYSNEKGCVLLKKLHEKVDDYYCDAVPFETLEKEKFLEDPKWIEIQQLAQKTKEELNKLAKHLEGVVKS